MQTRYVEAEIVEPPSHGEVPIQLTIGGEGITAGGHPVGEITHWGFMRFTPHHDGSWLVPADPNVWLGRHIVDWLREHLSNKQLVATYAHLKAIGLAALDPGTIREETTPLIQF